MPSVVAPPTTVHNPLARRRGRLPGEPAGALPQPRARFAPTRGGRRAVVLAGALGGGTIVVSLAVGVTALLLLAFGALFLSAFGSIATASIQDPPHGSSMLPALVQLVMDALGSATAVVLVVLAATLLLGAAGACTSAWLLRDFGAGRAWAITGVGCLIAVAGDALLATSATGLLAAPAASALPLLPRLPAGAPDSDAAILLTTIGFVIAMRLAVMIGLSIGAWMLAARLLRPRAAPRASGP